MAPAGVVLQPERDPGGLDRENVPVQGGQAPRREVELGSAQQLLKPDQVVTQALGRLLLECQIKASGFGDQFNLYDFHAGLLAGGALPIKLVRDELWERVRA